jgi:hypothetical protein
MNQQEVQPIKTDNAAGQGDKAASTGLAFGIGALLLSPPLAYLGVGLLYWLLQGTEMGFCSIPICPLPLILIAGSIVSCIKGMKSSRKKIAIAGLVITALAVILALVGGILGLMDATNPIPGGII